MGDLKRQSIYIFSDNVPYPQQTTPHSAGSRLISAGHKNRHWNTSTSVADFPSGNVDGFKWVEFATSYRFLPACGPWFREPAAI